MLLAILLLKLKFSVKRKGAEVVHEEFRQRLVADGAKLEKYDIMTDQYRENQTRRNCVLLSCQVRVSEYIYTP